MESELSFQTEWQGLRCRPPWEGTLEQTFGRGEGGSCEDDGQKPSSLQEQRVPRLASRTSRRSARAWSQVHKVRRSRE